MQEVVPLAPWSGKVAMGASLHRLTRLYSRTALPSKHALRDGYWSGLTPLWTSNRHAILLAESGISVSVLRSSPSRLAHSGICPYNTLSSSCVIGGQGCDVVAKKRVDT